MNPYTNWTQDRLDTARRMAAEGIQVSKIADAIGVTDKALRHKAGAIGIDLYGVAKARIAASDAVLRELYPTDMPAEEVHAAWRAAGGGERTFEAMRFRAEALGLRRGPGAVTEARRRGNITNAARYEEARRIKALAVQKRANEFASQTVLAKEFRMGRDVLRRMVLDGLLVFPPRPVVVKPPKPPRAPSPPKPRKPRVWVYSAPAAPKPRAQTVEEFLAMGGQITRLPTAAVCATQATIPAADVEALRAYRAATPENGNWMEQRRAWVARNKGTGVMAP